MKSMTVLALVAVTSTLFGTRSPADEEALKGTRKQFTIATNGIAACSLVVANLGDPHVAVPDQERQMKVGQLLQAYVGKLSGVTLPLMGLAASQTNSPNQHEILIDTGYRPSLNPCYQLGFTRYTDSGELVSPPGAGRITLVINANGPDCAKMALSNFVEKAFGPPLSAVDDPNYKWPHRPTLVIDAEKFETIKFPPDKRDGPRDLSPSDQR